MPHQWSTQPWIWERNAAACSRWYGSFRCPYCALENGANTEALSGYGWTPLHYAASFPLSQKAHPQRLSIALNASAYFLTRVQM